MQESRRKDKGGGENHREAGAAAESELDRAALQIEGTMM